MNSWVIWVVWGTLAFLAVLLCFVGRHFSLRTLRFVTAVIAAALVVLVTRYGLTHPANPAEASSDLADSFRQGANELSSALFHPLLLVLPGSQVPAPGRIGWIVIAVLLVIGYRVLEAGTMHRQAPELDTSTLGDSQPNDVSSKTEDGVTDRERHDQLVTQLKFQLSAIEVRAPAILPGGSRSNALASIAEASGVGGGSLAGAIIRFFGMLWPNPRRFQARVRVASSHSEPQDTDATKVTVSLDVPGTGESIATKTMMASNIDEAAALAAGYIARHIFARDPTSPPWCFGAANGRDLAAMLLAKQERVNPKSSKDIDRACQSQISILKKATGNTQCAGIVRYELAQLYDLADKHLEALRLHAVNREQYPRFYRGRYRLSMSLEMIANPTFQLQDADTDLLDEVLTILNRCRVTEDVTCQNDDIVDGTLKDKLLVAAGNELRAIRRELTLWHVIWETFRHRDERVILMPLWGLRKRQSFHDGVSVAELLVATHQSLNEKQRSGASERLHHMNLALRIVTFIAGDNTPIRQQLTPGEAQPSDRKLPSSEKRDRIRWLPWQCRTPSWEAAYNTACVYAALNYDSKYAALKLDHKVVVSLQRAISNRDCEMQRPWDSISHDLDFYSLKESSKEFKGFLATQEKEDYPAATDKPMNADGKEPAAGSSASSSSPEVVPAGERR
jgi:hypothetical protein